MTETPAYITATQLPSGKADDPRWQDDPTYTPLGDEWLAMCIEDAEAQEQASR